MPANNPEHVTPQLAGGTNEASRQISAVAEKILAQNIVNLAKKAKDGGVLSAAEVQLLRESVGNDLPIGWAKNQTELATALGVTRRSILTWSKRDGCPGARPDGRYNIEEWRTWAKANGLRVAAELDVGELRAEGQRLANEKTRHQLAILRRLYVPTDEVAALGAKLGAAIRKVVTTIHTIAPSLAGMTSVAEIEQALKDKEDDIIFQLQSLDEGLVDITTPTEQEALQDGEEDTPVA